MILEGGFRGWEAHDLPIQKIETTLSQKACDELAMKIGKDVSKLTGWMLCGYERQAQVEFEYLPN